MMLNKIPWAKKQGEGILYLILSLCNYVLPVRLIHFPESHFLFCTCGLMMSCLIYNIVKWQMIKSEFRKSDISIFFTNGKHCHLRVIIECLWFVSCISENEMVFFKIKFHVLPTNVFHLALIGYIKSCFYLFT